MPSDWQLPPVGQILVSPPGQSLVGLAGVNEATVSGWTFDVGGVPAGELRRQARAATLELALEWALRWGFEDGLARARSVMAAAAVGGSAGAGTAAVRPDGGPRPYLILTGHQPIWPHPGITVKNALVERLARRLGLAVALNVVVDHDTAPAVGVEVPVREAGRLRRRSVVLSPLQYGFPFCQAPAPSSAEWGGFREGVRAALASLGAVGEGLAGRFQALEGVGEGASGGGGAAGRRPLGEAAGLAEWMTVARHRWEQQALVAAGEGGAEYLEVLMGDLACTEPFRRLFAHVALDAGRFAAAYNLALAEYRRQHGVRSRANPFPDLAVRGERVELPFWVLTAGVRRRALHVEPERPGGGGVAALLLSTADGPLARLPLPAEASSIAVGAPAAPATPEGRRRLADAVVAALEGQGLAIRPRAAALTLFLRMFVADVFVHGVGGARYDRVTDDLIRGYFGAVPPQYAVASASLLVELAGQAGPAFESVDRLRQELRALRFNPQRFVAAAPPQRVSPRARELARRKLELVEAFNAPGAPRRALTREIEAVNRELHEMLQAVVEETKARLRQAMEADAERQALVYRGYPSFLHDVEAIWRAAERALAAGRREEDEAFLPAKRDDRLTG